MIGYNRLCDINDFTDESLLAVLRDIFASELAMFPKEYPNGVADSKQWEIAMAVRALRDHGQLRPDARLLGVGAGTELTSYYLTNCAREVVATDIYAHSEQWSDVAPLAFLADPAAFCTIPFDRSRLLPVHMDARVLDFPDDSFDGVFSSGSIEHFGSRAAVSNAAFEIGRVLKPGGIVALATEFKLAGAPGDGWDPDVILFSADTLTKSIIEASGLELVDDLHLELSDETLAERRDLVPFLNGTKNISHPTDKIGLYPNLVLLHEGYLFCSIHLTLRKGAAYPVVDNSWAKPGPDVRIHVQARRRAAAQRLSRVGDVGKTLLEMLKLPSDLPNLESERDALLAQRHQLSEGLTRKEQELLAARTELVALHDTLRVTDSARLATENALRMTQDLLQGTERALAMTRASTSWRVTAPLRAAVSSGRRLLRGR